MKPRTQKSRERARAASRRWYKNNKAKQSQTSKIYRENNKSIIKEKKKIWAENNKDHRKDYNLRYLYGISLNDYNRILKEQNECCAICKNTTQKFNVDHDHTINKVRGLLCDSCNLGIGKFYDSPELLEAAAFYLRGFSCKD